MADLERGTLPSRLGKITGFGISVAYFEQISDLSCVWRGRNYLLPLRSYGALPHRLISGTPWPGAVERKWLGHLDRTNGNVSRSASCSGVQAPHASTRWLGPLHRYARRVSTVGNRTCFSTSTSRLTHRPLQPDLHGEGGDATRATAGSQVDQQNSPIADVDQLATVRHRRPSSLGPKW